MTGEVVKDNTDKTVKVQPKKSASADVKKTAKDGGQKAAKVTTLKAVMSRSVRSKRRVNGEGKPAAVLLTGSGMGSGVLLPGVWPSLHVSGCICC